MTDDVSVTPSSGNVFADLGLKNPDEHLLKSMLAMRIAAAITARGDTQHAAATLLGIDQPKVSKLVRGDLYGFSSDQLFRFLLALGQDVEIIVRTPDPVKGRGTITVKAA